MESSLECEVCFTEYDSKEHRPKSLPCGHSICVTCVKDTLKTKEGKMNCPFCRTPCGTGVKTLDDFPTTFALLNIINTGEQKNNETLSPREKEKKILEQKKEAECKSTGTHISNCNGHLQRLHQSKETQELALQNIRLEISRLEEEEKKETTLRDNLDDIVAEGNDIVKGLEALQDRLRSASSLPGFNLASQDVQKYYAASQEWTTSRVTNVLIDDTNLTKEDLVKAVNANDAAGATLALQRGVDPNTTCSMVPGKTGPVLCYAVLKQYMDVVIALLEAKTIDVDKLGDDEVTALRIAIRNNYDSIVQILLSKGANPNLITGDVQCTPLLHVISKGSCIIGELLIQHGALPNLSCGRHGRTPLLASVLKDKFSMAEMLIKNGALPNIVSGEHGRSPLVAAAQRGSLELSRLLLQYGANPNAMDAKGWFSLYCAAERGHKDVAELLVQFGADPQMTLTNSSRTAADQALRKGNNEIYKWLLVQNKVDMR